MSLETNGATILVNGATESVSLISTTGLGGAILSLGGFATPTPVSLGTSGSVAFNGTFTGAAQMEKRFGVWLLMLGVGIGILGAVML
jgi:hypothetical protein